MWRWRFLCSDGGKWSRDGCLPYWPLGGLTLPSLTVWGQCSDSQSLCGDGTSSVAMAHKAALASIDVTTSLCRASAVLDILVWHW